MLWEDILDLFEKQLMKPNHSHQKKTRKANIKSKNLQNNQKACIAGISLSHRCPYDIVVLRNANINATNILLLSALQQKKQMSCTWVSPGQTTMYTPAATMSSLHNDTLYSFRFEVVSHCTFYFENIHLAQESSVIHQKHLPIRAHHGTDGH